MQKLADLAGRFRPGRPAGCGEWYGTALGVWHACCTCRMGAESDPTAVTDPRGRVYGVRGQRVVDASIFPDIPSANIHLTTLMVAEKIADEMRGAAQ